MSVAGVCTLFLHRWTRINRVGPVLTIEDAGSQLWLRTQVAGSLRGIRYICSGGRLELPRRGGAEVPRGNVGVRILAGMTRASRRSHNARHQAHRTVSRLDVHTSLFARFWTGGYLYQRTSHPTKFLLAFVLGSSAVSFRP